MMMSEMEKQQIPHANVPFDEAQRIGIIFNATEVTNHIFITEYAAKLRRLNKNVKIMGYIEAERKDNFLSFPYFSIKDLNWYLRPVSPSVLEFLQQPFDILINAYADDVMPLEYISAFSKARFRVGPYLEKKTFCSDFMIHYKGSVKLERLLNDIHEYLLRLKK